MEESSSDSSIQQRSKRINYSADPIPTLPSEIISEILLRLPVKSLLKFRCVSKSWLSLISSPEFRKAHLKHSTNDPNLTFHRIMFTIAYPRCNLRYCSLRSLLYEPTTDAAAISYPRKNPRRSVWVVGSCNGLICIAINDKDLFLWNPSLRKSKKLPDVDVPMVRGFYVVYGFGFDEINEDYKVVGIFCAFRNAGGYETLVRIYSLKTNSWRTIEQFKFGVPLDDCSVFAQGKLHWSCSPGEGFSSAWDIVALDLDKETYGMLEQPKYGEGDFSSTLGVVGGCICVLCNFPKTRADVWVLKDYLVKESWTKVVSIPYVDDPGKYVYSIPLFILPDGEVLVALGSGFIVYNLEMNSFRYPQISNVNDFLGVTTYVESLVSPDADGE